MKINKQDLLKALELVKPGLANREIIEQSNSFAFIDGIVTTFNDEICLTHKVEGLNITGAIKAAELYALLSKLKKAEIEVTLTKNEIQFISGKAKATFTLQKEIKLPIDSLGKKGKWKDLPENFIKALKFTMGACTRDMSQPLLTCVNVTESGVIEGSDSYRISHFVLGEKMPIKTFLLPASSASNVVKLNPTQIAEGNGWIHFKTKEETTLSCRIFEDDSYPDTSKFLKIKGEKLTFPEIIKDMLDRAMVFCKREQLLDETVEISIANSRFKIKSQSESGRFEEDIRTSFAGTLSFEIKPYLLKDILSETLDCIVSTNRLKFEGENWQYITSL
jgi:hypothetical protein